MRTPRSLATVLLLLCASFALFLLPGTASAAAPVTGWGSVNASTGTGTWAYAYRWNAAQSKWETSWRWTHTSVYLSTWTTAWTWTWTQTSGWLAMRAVDVRNGCGLGAKLVPTCGALLGASQATNGGESWSQALTRHEQTINRVDTATSTNDGLDIVHSYHLWKDSFPTADESAQAARGKYLLINWKPLTTRTGNGVVPWKSIAAGSENTVIDAQCRRFVSFQRPLFVAFHHEPEDQVGSAYGTAADYKAAFRYVRSRCDAAGAKNVSWVWNVMGFSKWWPMYDGMYPGNDVVDWVAYDPYNVMGCGGWTTAEKTIGTFYDWAQQHSMRGKPMMLGEWGACENPGKGAFFGDALRLAKAARFPLLKAYVYFNHYEWPVETSQQSLNGYRALAADSYFNVRR